MKTLSCKSSLEQTRRNQHLVNTAGCSCARHERTDNLRRISSEFPKRHAFSVPWARKTLPACERHVCGCFNRSSIKTLLLRSYQWTLHLGFPLKHITCAPHPHPTKKTRSTEEENTPWPLLKTVPLCKSFLCIDRTARGVRSSGPRAATSGLTTKHNHLKMP